MSVSDNRCSSRVQGSQIQKEEKYTFDYNLQEAEKKTPVKPITTSKKTLYLDEHKLVLVGADGATWIKEGARDCFPQSIYQLCPFHLKRKLTQTLSYNRIRQSETRLLLQQGKITQATLSLEEEKRKNPEKAKEIKDLITYLINNREGINAVDCLKEAGLPVDTHGSH